MSKHDTSGISSLQLLIVITAVEAFIAGCLTALGSYAAALFFGALASFFIVYILVSINDLEKKKKKKLAAQRTERNSS